ncbi:MAG: hypothetical protein AB1728_11385 [Bacteroidota bacterium]
MLEYLDTSPDINVPEAEFKRLLGYPANYDVSDRVQELMEKTRRWYSENGAPWVYVRHIDAFELHHDHFFIGEIKFSAERFITQMRETMGESVVAVAASAGKNCEGHARQLWKEEKPDEYFFMEVYGSAIVEHIITKAAGKICAWAESNAMVALPRQSPGYSGWDVREQQALFDVINRGRNYNPPEEIHVMHTGMLNPKKSQLTIFGLTRHRERVRQTAELIPCVNCSLEQCQYRRSVYTRAVRLVEDVENLRSNIKSDEETPLELNAKYSFSRHALEKWSKERLQLQFNEDGSIQAAFRYQGTTCSNMGHLLEFDYHIKLGLPQNKYTILETSCLPAPGDDGYKYMCQYIEDPDSFMLALRNGMPLVGKPLNDIGA